MFHLFFSKNFCLISRGLFCNVSHLKWPLSVWKREVRAPEKPLRIQNCNSWNSTSFGTAAVNMWVGFMAFSYLGKPTVSSFCVAKFATGANILSYEEISSWLIFFRLLHRDNCGYVMLLWNIKYQAQYNQDLIPSGPAAPGCSHNQTRSGWGWVTAGEDFCGAESSEMTCADVNKHASIHRAVKCCWSQTPPNSEDKETPFEVHGREHHSSAPVPGRHFSFNLWPFVSCCLPFMSQSGSSLFSGHSRINCRAAQPHLWTLM